MIRSFHKKIMNISPDFFRFLLAVSLIGFAQSIVDSTFNNFLNDKFSLSGIQRTFLELPREFPGFLVIFVSGMLFFMCNRTMAAFSQLLTSAGVILIGLFSKNYQIMLVWLFVFSTGQHLFIPLSSDIGMELAHSGQTGKRLGQLQAAGNFTAIIGSFFVFLGFKFLNFTFTVSFLISGIFYFLAFFCMLAMRKNKPVSLKSKFRLRREYGFYYWLAVLFGTRKQIFLTFAPWVLVTVFHQKTQTIATLLTIGGIIGIGFKPLLGRAIDHWGERVIFIGEALLLILICLGYGFSGRLFSESAALTVICICYIIDQLLISVNMARATYLKKISLHPEDVTSTLTMGTTIDHVFSISIALLGGMI
ncbi:MAG: MFS transporter, partial [bacterium]|nr:MFS transporter [bacterium]